MSELAGARVVVTGGTGFLGRHVCDALRERGAFPVPLGRADGDLRARADFDGADHVVHCAALGGGIGWMRKHPATALHDNVLINTNVLEGARRSGVRRLVGVSSACAYAVDAPQPMREDAIFAGQPEPTNGPYGHAKRLMLVHGAALAAEHGFDCAFAVPTNLYGPGDDFDPARSHLVAALVRKFVAGDGNCWGTGRATRDLLHVRDCAEGVVRLLEVGGGPSPVNLGSGEERTVAAVAEAVARAAGYEGTVRWDTTKPDGMPRKVLDITRAHERLGWAPRVSLEDGLAETVAWFRSSS
ncbi:MAG: NAD-dependent epimerase/dehydratase family protein [Myxococcota bacterium]